MLEQLVAEVDAVPEADDVPLDGDVVLAVKSGRRETRKRFTALTWQH